MKRMRSRRRALLAGLLALPALNALAAGTDLPAAVDLRADADRAARAGAPLVVVFSRHDCKYCETVKRDYLKPLATQARYRDRVVVRQINQDSDAPLVDFRGETTTHARFAASEKIRLVPVVAFYGPQGRRLAEPIVGARLPDFYPSYLEEAVEKSALALTAR
ncbi:thioredoxin family protein [Dechloromonas sp. H13]|uniref:SoxW family protein n=1 Tax=Dechloromonas sp. H13 TaxID=2570193 RepID=UPI0012925269|nr:thioredoxin family protein [Dechloromonas sp. H13]